MAKTCGIFVDKFSTMSYYDSRYLPQNWRSVFAYWCGPMLVCEYHYLDQTSAINISCTYIAFFETINTLSLYYGFWQVIPMNRHAWLQWKVFIYQQFLITSIQNVNQFLDKWNCFWRIMTVAAMCCKNNNNRVESVVPGGFIELCGYRLNKWVVVSSHQFFNLANVANDDR